jgi:hypothetical protein
MHYETEQDASWPDGVGMIDYPIGVPSIRPRSSFRGASWSPKSSG